MVRSFDKLKRNKDVHGLIKVLKDKDSDVLSCLSRCIAEEALGEIGDKRAIDPLIKALKDEDLNVREYAAEALGKIGDKRAIEPLIKALKDKNKKWYVLRRDAAEALGKIGDKRAIDPLIKALEDEDEYVDVREYAAIALGKIGDKRAIDPLIKTLKDEDKYWHIRGNTAEVLGKIGDPRAVPALEKAINDFDEFVRKKAREALDKCKAIEEITQLEKEPTTEYLLDKAKHFVSKALDHFKSKDYPSAIEKWKKAIPEYQRAIDLAARRGETDFVESINASIETTRNNILTAEIQIDHDIVVDYINKSNHEIEKGNYEYENGDYKAAKTHFEKSIDLLKSANPIAEKRDFSAFLDSIKASVPTLYESCCACILEDAKSYLNKNKFAEAERSLTTEMDYIRKRGTDEHKFELNQLLEDGRKGVAWSKIASAKLELEATGKLYESGAYLEARDACLQIKERLKEVFDFVIKYDLLKEKKELDELNNAIDENIQKCLIGHANTLLGAADALFKEKRVFEGKRCLSKCTRIC